MVAKESISDSRTRVSSQTTGSSSNHVNSGTSAGQADSCWSRRAKVPLAGITPALLQSAIRSPHGMLEAKITGTGRDGGPACASVPLLAGWTLVAAA
jgi:hypothetical protein